LSQIPAALFSAYLVQFLANCRVGDNTLTKAENAPFPVLKELNDRFGLLTTIDVQPGKLLNR
jgi:hypothetical protein